MDRELVWCKRKALESKLIFISVQTKEQFIFSSHSLPPGCGNLVVAKDEKFLTAANSCICLATLSRSLSRMTSSSPAALAGRDTRETFEHLSIRPVRSVVGNESHEEANADKFDWARI